MASVVPPNLLAETLRIPTGPLSIAKSRHSAGLYFAYGSNLWLPRIRQRVPGVRRVGQAVLHGWSLCWHKRGGDGSGKCDVVPTSTSAGGSEPGAVDGELAQVHGALYRIPPAEIPLLDRVEALGVGYDRRAMTVRTGGGEVQAWSYTGRPETVDPALRPFDWYREFVIRGAESLGVPQAYLRGLRSVAAEPDPNPDRAGRERKLLW